MRAALWWVLMVCTACTGCQQMGWDVADVGTRSARPVDQSVTVAECRKFSAIKSAQQTPVWCWAASAQMVGRYYGHEESQESIAARIHGTGADGSAEVKAASFAEILRALADERVADKTAWTLLGERMLAGSGPVTLDVAHYLNSQASRYTLTTDDMVRELRSANPVVVGMSSDPRFTGGHAMVAYRVEYRAASGGVFKPQEKNVSQYARWVNDRLGMREWEIVSVTVLDPWTGEPQVIPGDVFRDNVDFMVSRELATRLVQEELNAVKGGG